MNVPLFGRSAARRRRTDRQLHDGDPVATPQEAAPSEGSESAHAGSGDPEAMPHGASSPEEGERDPGVVQPVIESIEPLTEGFDDTGVSHVRGAARPPRERTVDAAVARWREKLLASSGGSALWDVEELGAAVIDLSAAHPSGLAQLYAGRPTLLSNLVREAGALASARRSARTVLARSGDLTATYGLAPTYLAVGVATWDERAPVGGTGQRRSPDDAPEAEDHPGSGPAETAPVPVRAPVLLRPVRLEPLSDGNLELTLEPAIEINDVLLRAVRAAGAAIDAPDVVRSASSRHGFSPRVPLSRIAAIAGTALPRFQIAESIMIGSFVHPGTVLVEDLDALGSELAGHRVIAALAGDDGAREELWRPLPDPVAGDRPPQGERGAGDLGPDQQHLIDAAAAGIDVFVDAPPGADVPAAVAGVAADAAASGRSVLYVTGRRPSAEALVAELVSLGLEQIVLDVDAEPRWRTAAAERLRAGLSAELEHVDVDSLRRVRSDLLRTREELSGYVAALHEERQPWGISAHTALQRLAELVSGRHVPRTKVRWPAETLTALVGDHRQHVRELLVRAGSLGAFELRRHETPWFGARLAGAEEAVAALERAQRLAEITLPELQENIARTARQTGLDPATTTGEWLEQLRMLDGVSAALDVFVPEIFERSAADMVIATASRTWRKEHSLDMNRRTRRRLRKQAEDLLRPGRPVENLHAELVEVQKQRDIWRRHCPTGAWPRVPEGLETMRRHAEQVHSDLEALAGVLPEDSPDLADLPLPRLLEITEGLGRDSEAVRLLPERTAVLAELTEAGLGELLADLVARRVPTGQLGAEFDLAWWASVLEDVLRSDKLLAHHDGRSLRALADRFRALDSEHVSTLPGPIRRAITRRLRTLVSQRSRETEQLAEALDDGGGSLPQIVGRHPQLITAARPVWVVPPVLVAQLVPQGVTFDVLVLDGVEHLPTEQIISALSRARQVMLVGDSTRGGDGVSTDLAPLLPRVPLATDRAQRHGAVAGFLSEHLYGGSLRAIPSPPGAEVVRFELVEGRGMPAPGAEAVESVRDEVDKVVDLVIEHVLNTPERSLAVIALNVRHAERIRAAIDEAVSGSAAVASYFDASAPEPFVVIPADQAAGLSRDAVVVAIGFAKTPHGRILHRFGPISSSRGAGYLVDALVAARGELIVVSAIGPGEIERERLRQPGAHLLADLIDWAGHVRQAAGAEEESDEVAAPDPLLIDLAERLWRLGLEVVPQYGLEGGVRVPLALGHPDLPGELLVAVLTDSAEYVAEPNLRRRDRHWVQRLEERGWKVYTAFSTAVFIDPQREAEAIVDVVLNVVDERRGLSEPVVIESIELPPERVDDTDLDDDAEISGHETEPPPPGSPEPETDPQDASATRPAEAPAAGTRSEGSRSPTTARGERPDIRVGMPFSAYTDDDLDALAVWVLADGIERDELEFAAALRQELGVERRSAHVDLVLARVAARHLHS